MNGSSCIVIIAERYIYVTYYTEVQVFEEIVMDVDMDSWQYFDSVHVSIRVNYLDY